MEQKNGFTQNQNTKKRKTLLTIGSVLVFVFAVVAVILVIWNSSKSNNQKNSTTIPQVTKPQFVSDRLKERYKYNSDVVGWLTVPGTDIDEEVLQSTDNDYYLRKTIDKEKSVWGCYFVDYKCNVKSRKELSRVTVVYGHSLKDYSDGKKFTQLKRYNDINFLKQNQVITFSLLYEKLQFKIFAISKMPITFNYIESEPSDEQFGQVLAKLYENKVHFFDDIQVDKDDNILLLQTCTSDMNYRYIVAAKLIEK